MSRHRHVWSPVISFRCDFLEGGWSPLVKECRAHVFLDCEYTPRHEAQSRAQRRASSIR